MAVLGFLMGTSKRDNVALRHIAERLNPIVKEGTTTALTHPLMLMDLLPDETNNFYRYNGSLVSAISIFECHQIMESMKQYLVDDSCVQRGRYLDCF